MRPPHQYTIYGLRLQSNRPIHGLKECSNTHPPEVRVWLDGLPGWLSERTLLPSEAWYTNANVDDGGRPLLTVWKLADEACFLLRYADGTEFVVDRPGTQIWAAWPATNTLDDTLTYLVGPVLGLVLRQRGVPCLHASAVAVGGYAIAFVGPAGAGKSSTAACLAQRGYPVLTEDVTPIIEASGSLLVQPGYLYIRLWPNAVQLFFGSPNALPQLAPPWEKCYLDLHQKGYRVQQESLPLGAVYLFGERSEDPACPFVEPVAAYEGLIHLVGNTYVNYLLDRTMRGQEFEFLSRLASRIPLRRVTPHSDPLQLPRLCDVIVNDFQALVPESTG